VQNEEKILLDSSWPSPDLVELGPKHLCPFHACPFSMPLLKNVLF